MLSELQERLCSYVDRHHPAQVRLLAELVKLPSDNPPGDCAPHAIKVHRSLRDLGLRSSGIAFQPKCSRRTA
jgi:succinyl-diaminopimelate desuccinylase